ncbi:MAG TPA: ferritin-like domain-containing protein [Phycisphaerales bacterium]|nr:ferritin-like domain-containing protein [Phycisphaerales bacterium]
MKIDTLDKLYIHELKDLYNAEIQLVRALPKMAKAASHEDLRAAFEEHLEVTKAQAGRLEQIFESLGISGKGKKCEAMLGLIEEAKNAMDEIEEPDVLDAALITAAQRVEHYEMAGYGTVRTWARQLGREEEAQILQQTLDEEGETDKKLTMIAESMVNREAEQAGSAGEDEEGGGGARGSSAGRNAGSRRNGRGGGSAGTGARSGSRSTSRSR